MSRSLHAERPCNTPYNGRASEAIALPTEVKENVVRKNDGAHNQIGRCQSFPTPHLLLQITKTCLLRSTIRSIRKCLRASPALQKPFGRGDSGLYPARPRDLVRHRVEGNLGRGEPHLCAAVIGRRALPLPPSDCRTSPFHTLNSGSGNQGLAGRYCRPRALTRLMLSIVRIKAGRGLEKFVARIEDQPGAFPMKCSRLRQRKSRCESKQQECA